LIAVEVFTEQVGSSQKMGKDLGQRLSGILAGGRDGDGDFRVVTEYSGEFGAGIA
jgi:hypothetical protein